MPHVEPVPTDSRLAVADGCRTSEGVGQRWVDAPTWQLELASAVRDLDELLRLVGLPERSPLGGDGSGNGAFPLLVPRSFVRRIRPGDPHDPLLRQVLPSPREHQPELAGEGVVATGYRDDPVGDTAATVAAGLLQKYAGRALIVATGTCAVHCRYCFRQHFDYGELPRGGAAWEPTLRQIAADASLHEIIISGGDPLSWSDGRLAALVEPLASIEHVRRVRIHTRLPIVVPSRVTDTLTALLADLPARVWMVVHANHAAELDASVAAALRRLAAAGVPLLNQAVLLRGVNDSVDALAELGERLVDVGVVPYYLHQLDRVRGAAHFDVPVREGVRLVRALSERLPGYAVPRYVQERAGASHKIDLLDTAGAHADRAAIAPDRY